MATSSASAAPQLPAVAVPDRTASSLGVIRCRALRPHLQSPIPCRVDTNHSRASIPVTSATPAQLHQHLSHLLKHTSEPCWSAMPSAPKWPLILSFPCLHKHRPRSSTFTCRARSSSPMPTRFSKDMRALRFNKPIPPLDSAMMSLQTQRPSLKLGHLASIPPQRHRSGWRHR